MTKIEITNYKTIKHVAFDFEGYTLILGRNFIGKSALVGAIVSAFINRNGDDFIRYGEDFCEVKIERDGHVVLWHKERGPGSYYLIDGVEYKKIGRADLPQPIVDMGFAPIEVAGEKTLLWYAKQLEVLFLVNKNRQNYATDLISSVAKLDAVYKSVDIAKKDLKDYKSSLKVRSTDLRDTREQLKKYDPLEAWDAGAPVIAGWRQQLVLAEKDIEFVTTVITKIDSLKAELQRTFPATKLEAVSLSELEQINAVITETTDILVRYVSAVNAYNKNKDITKAEDIPSERVSEVAKLFSDIAVLGSLSARYHRESSVLDATSKVQDISIPSTAALDTLVASISELRGLGTKYEAATKELDASSVTLAIPDHSKLDGLIADITSIADLNTRYSKAVSDVATSTTEAAQVEKDLKEALKNLEGVDCPLCGTPYENCDQTLTLH